MTTHPRIFLRRGKEESLLRRHPWIFSGAIGRVECPSDTIAEGEIVDVHTAAGDFIARGHYQIGSIAVRVLTFAQEPIDAAWWRARIRSACEVRRTLGLIGNAATTCYRLVHGEGDSLPGLVIDIYGTTAVVQCHSVGMYRSRMQIAEALREVYGERLAAVYDKSSQTVPYKAGLNAVDGYLMGKVATPTQEVSENGHRFLVNWEEGQKTGFFLDQRCNRELVERYAAGRTVLNTFCYTGGFSVYAAAGGAKEVCSVDASERAKHHKVLGNAMQGYKRLNARALSQIRPGGILFTFSCSQAVTKELFRTTVFSAAAIAGRNVRILHQLAQPADHPINIYHPEGEYLKGLVLYVE